MSLLTSHALSAEKQRWLTGVTRSRKAKAVLALIRVQQMLGLSDEELVEAVNRVTEKYGSVTPK